MIQYMSNICFKGEDRGKEIGPNRSELKRSEHQVERVCQVYMAYNDIEKNYLNIAW